MRKVLVQQNLHWEDHPYEKLLSRDLVEEIKPLISIEEILIFLGIRRSGKSTLFKLVINQLIKTISSKSILYINFDDPYFEITYDDPKKIYQIIETAEEITEEKIEYVFFDEIHNVEAWERFVKSNYDSRTFKKIFITGSNSKLLLSEYASLLTGRYIDKRVWPLSFAEILNKHDIKDKVSLIKNKIKIKKILKDMMQYGSYAKVLLTEDTDVKRELLISYYNAILYKDCIKNSKIRDVKTFEKLSHYLITHATNATSYHAISKVLDCSDITIREFIGILESSFMISELNHFYFSQKKQIKQKKKYYIADNGLIHAVAFQFTSNLGKLFENLVFTELKKTGHEEIYYYTEDKECDFLVKKGNELTAIQACYELNDQNREREISGLRYAMDKLSCKNGFIITLDQEERLDAKVMVVPFWGYFGSL